MNILKRKNVGPEHKFSRFGNAVQFLTIFLLGLFMLAPLVFTVVQSLKPVSELYQFPPKFYVQRPTMENYRVMLSMMSSLTVPFARYLFNSLFVAVTATVLHVLFAAMCAYPLAKHNFPGREILWNLILVALMFVSQVLLIPNFIISVKLGILDTYAAYILPNIGATVGLFLLRQFIIQLPDPLLEAARIDGASEYRTFWSIVAPNIKPALFTVFIFQFVHVWNNTPQDMVYSEELKIIRVALSQIGKADAIARYGPSMAASVLLMLPPIAVFLLFQRNVVETMTSAGIK